MYNAKKKKNELMHYGIMGMKWGVRRYQNSDGSLTEDGKRRYSRSELKNIRSEKHKLKDKYYKEDSNYKKARELEKKAYKLQEKYGFDADDGGGGKTKAAEKAGNRYMEMWDDIAALEDMAAKNSVKKAEKYIKDTYGDVAVSQLQYQDTARAYGAAAALMAIPVAALAFTLKH